jgi:hypothetical protein
MKKLYALVALSLCAAPAAYAQNGGTTCAAATVMASNTTYTADTTAAPNWMSSFGPLVSPSNDVIYTFTTAAGFSGAITPSASDYAFALYLIPSCAQAGTEPTPIGATATVGTGIDLAGSGVTAGNTYFLAVTGTAAGGAGANGTVTFTTPTFPVTLQSFEID